MSSSTGGTKGRLAKQGGRQAECLTCTWQYNSSPLPECPTYMTSNTQRSTESHFEIPQTKVQVCDKFRAESLSEMDYLRRADQLGQILSLRRQF